MKAVIHSRRAITDAEKRKIRKILNESVQPDKSLSSAFYRFSHMDGQNIYFDDEYRKYETEIDYKEVIMT